MRRVLHPVRTVVGNDRWTEADVSTEAQPMRRPAARRAGYVVSIIVNVALVYLINVRPGWQIVPFLTDATPAVLGLVNASIVATVAANAVYVVYDPRWLRALGGMATTGVGLAAMVRIWRVFPFDFDDSTLDWVLIFRIMLAVGILGSLIGLVAQFASLIRASARRERRPLKP